MIRAIINLILSFGLVVTFLGRFVELTTKLYPDTGLITIGRSTLPSWLAWVISVNNALGTKLGISILLVLTFIAFVYELVNTIRRVFKKNNANAQS